MHGGPGQQKIDLLVSRFKQKRYLEAETLARSMTQRFPRYGFGWKALGVVLRQTGRSGDALAPMQKAAALSPGDAEAHYNLGNALRDLGQLDDVVASYRRALEIRPDYAEAHNNLGNVLQDLGRLDDSLASYRRALEIKPDYADAHYNLGKALQDLGRFDDSLASCRRALEIKPDYAEAHNNLGAALQELGRLDDAVASCRRALEIKPDFVKAHYNLGNALRDQGNLDESFQHYQRALALDQNNDNVRFSLTILYLLKGDLEPGWAGYEYRFTKRIEPIKKREFALPYWQGESLEDKTILVWGEQGIGDEIMFASCLPQVIAASRHCTVECSPRLETLFRRSFPQASIYALTAGGEPPPAEREAGIDAQVAMGSLPQHLRRSRSDFPRHHGYLKADPERVQVWRERLAALGPGLKVGISWQGGTLKTRRPTRSIPLAQWALLLQSAGVQCVSLQYTECSAEIAAVESATGVHIADWREVRDDLEHTAALITALDLVISVCTAAIHLGGALGRPVWVLAPYSPEWRYGIAGDEMPWYPSVRVFRQPRFGAWEPVIAEVAQCLRALAGKGSNR